MKVQIDPKIMSEVNRITERNRMKFEDWSKNVVSRVTNRTSLSFSEWPPDIDLYAIWWAGMNPNEGIALCLEAIRDETGADFLNPQEKELFICGL